MDQEHLHRLVKELIDASEMLTDMVSVFGEDSDQARQADERYVSAAATYHREHHWEKYCATEGPWEPECRMSDC